MRLVQISLLIFFLQLGFLKSYQVGWILVPGAPDQTAFQSYIEAAVQSRSFGRTATPPLDKWRGTRVKTEKHMCLEDERTPERVRYYCAGRISFSPAENVEYQGIWLLRNRGIMFRLNLDNAEAFIGIRVDFARPWGDVIARTFRPKG